METWSGGVKCKCCRWTCCFQTHSAKTENSQNFLTGNLNSKRQAHIRQEQRSKPRHQNAMFVRMVRAAAGGEGGWAEEVDRRAYKVKLQLTSKKLHIIKGKRSGQTISTADIWQALAVRRPAGRAWQAELSSLHHDVCCSESGWHLAGLQPP